MSDDVFQHFTAPRTLEAITELEERLQEYRPRCKESLFKTNFLPFFTSTDSNLRMDYWLNNLEVDPKYRETDVNPNSPVDVYDDITGSVLFTVPPLFGALNYKRLHPDRSFESMANIALIQGKDFPPIGRRLLLDAADGFKSDELTDDQRTWITILTRYGLLDKVMGKEPSDSGEVAVVEAETSPFSGGFNEL